MAITLTGSGGLFTIFRKVVTALSSANTSQGTTIPNAVNSLLSEVQDANTVDGMALVSRLSASVSAYKSQTSLQRELATFFRNLLINRVVADAPHVPGSQENCVNELIRQMTAVIPPQTVERNVVSAAVTLSPSGAPTLIATDTGGDGRTLQQIIPELIVGRYQSASSLLLESGAVQRDKLSPSWPDESGIRQTLAVDSSGLLTNQSFDLDTARANVPDDWTLTVGQVGTTFALTVTEVQTITISGGPTSGTWIITFTRIDGVIQSTSSLAFNASASAVQSALAALEGLEDVEVSSTGTLPATVVYTVKFNAVAPPGNQNLLVVNANLNTGSVVVAEVTAGQISYEFRAVTIIGNGTELTAFRQPLQNLALSPSTCYGFSLQLRASEVTLAGSLVAELIDSTGAVITDDAGSNNRLTVVLNTVSATTFAPVTAVFRTPANLPEVFYLQIRLSVAMAAAKVLYVDDCLLMRMSELYRGGPLACLSANQRSLRSTDRYEITAANNFAGSIQTYFGRIFDRQLPSAALGTETIVD